MASNERRTRIREEIDAAQKRRLRHDAQAKEKEEANRQRREQKAARQRASSGQGPARTKSTLSPDERLRHLKNLGLTASNDTLLELKKAYRRLALLYHPDKNPRGEAIMKVLNVSYAALQ
jgi:hypothetical protein